VGGLEACQAAPAIRRKSAAGSGSVSGKALDIKVKIAIREHAARLVGGYSNECPQPSSRGGQFAADRYRPAAAMYFLKH